MKRFLILLLRTAVGAVTLLLLPAPSAAPTEGFATVDDVRIRYLIEGSGSAVVLLHGFTHTGDSWLPLMSELSRTHTVIAPDLPGLGKSSRPKGGYDKMTVAREIHGLLKRLGIDRATVVGHDIGLMVAYAYAGQYREQVRRLVVMEAPLPGFAPWDQILLDPRDWHFHFIGPTAEKLVAGRERIYLDSLWDDFAADPKAIPESERRSLTKSYSQPGAMKASFAYFAAFRQDAVDNRRLFAQKLTIPVLAIGGDKSMGATMGTQARQVANSVEVRVLKNTGHWLLNERRAETVAMITDFIRDDITIGSSAPNEQTTIASNSNRFPFMHALANSLWARE